MYCNTSAVARTLSVTRQTVNEWARKGLLPSAVLPSGHRRFDINAVRQFASKHGYYLQELPK